MKQRPTWRWLVTRFELVVGATCLALPPVLFTFRPHFSGDFGPPEWVVLLGEALLVAGYLGMIVGLLWMVRIARRSPEDGRPSIWRYRER